MDSEGINPRKRRQPQVLSSEERKRRNERRNERRRQQLQESTSEERKECNERRRQKYQETAPRRRQQLQETAPLRNARRRQQYEETAPEELQRTNARRREQHHERQEEKIAPTFDTPIDDLRDPSRLNFGSFETNAETATVLFHLNRGILQYNFDDINELKKEIKREQLNDDERMNLITKFQTVHNFLGPIRSCGACGLKDWTPKDYKQYPVSQLTLLKLKPTEMDRWNDEKNADPLQIPTDRVGVWRSVHLSRLRSIYESEDGAYHLHPELVDEEGRVFLCKECSAKIGNGVIPELSLANGIEFGFFHRLGLTMPNFMEQMIIARVRLYRKVIKVQKRNHGSNEGGHSSLRSHCIVFGHDAPMVASGAVNPHDLKDVLTLHLMGVNRDEVDRLMIQTTGSSVLIARPFVIYQWLLVLKECNDRYEGINLEDYEHFEETISTVNSHLHDNVIETRDDQAMRRDEIITDDIAAVRIQDHEIPREPVNEPGPAESNESVPINVSTSFVSNNAPNENAALTFLQVVADGINVNARQDEENFYSSERERNPVNEFENNDFILTGAFPFIFLYGTAYGRCSGLTNKQVRHLLLQFTNVPATSKDLIFFLYNQQVRHNSIREMSSKVKGNPVAFQTFSEKILTLEFRNKLKRAIQDPTSKAASQVLRTVLPVLEVVNKKAHGGALDAGRVKSHMLAMATHFGSGTVFFTISPDDINNPKSFRLAQRTIGTNSLPCVVSDEQEFLTTMMDDSTIMEVGTIPFPVNYTARAKAAVDNPVATTLEYMALMDNVLEILIGVTRNEKKKRTQYFLQGSKGVFGYLNAGEGVNEVQARLALHLHIILFGGLRPKLLEHASTIKVICKTVALALNEMYCAELPREVHIADLLQNHLPRNLKHSKMPPILKFSCKKFQTVHESDRSALLAATTTANIHTHRGTCHKPPNGFHGCRLNRPCAIRSETTVVQLDRASIKENVPTILQEIEQPQEFRRGPFLLPDPRVLAWELQRIPMQPLPVLSPPETKQSILLNLSESLTETDWDVVRPSLERMDEVALQELYRKVSNQLCNRNGYVVEFNKTITSLTGCNTAVMMLGNAMQSKSALFYLSDYFAKNKVELSHVLSTLEESRRHIDSHPSLADDTGSTTRTVQHWLTRTANSLTSASEVADTQAVAALLNGTVEFTSECFRLVGIHECLHFIRDRRVDEVTISASTDSGNPEMHGYTSDDGFVTIGEEEDVSIPIDDTATDRTINTSNHLPEFVENVGNVARAPIITQSDDDNLSDDTTTKRPLRHKQSPCYEPNLSDDDRKLPPQMSHSLEYSDSSIESNEVENEVFHQTRNTIPPQYELSASSRGWGPAIIYRVKENKDSNPTCIPICIPEHYEYRGEELRELNRIEYYCLIETRTLSSDKTDKKPEGSRQHSTNMVRVFNCGLLIPNSFAPNSKFQFILVACQNHPGFLFLNLTLQLIRHG